MRSSFDVAPLLLCPSSFPFPPGRDKVRLLVGVPEGRQHPMGELDLRDVLPFDVLLDEGETKHGRRDTPEADIAFLIKLLSQPEEGKEQEAGDASVVCLTTSGVAHAGGRPRMCSGMHSTAMACQGTGA